MFKSFIDELKVRLLKPLPGKEAQYLMAPLERRMMKEFIPAGVTPRLGSVLVLFYPEGDNIMTVMMRRPDGDVVHAGQISFPGGKKEDSDPDLAHTALRETEEETGAEARSISIIGRLSDLYIPPSNFHVHPHIGYSSTIPNFEPDPREVAELIHVELKELKDPSNVKTMLRFNKTLGKEVETPYFEIKGNVVWGATAMMLSELREILK